MTHPMSAYHDLLARCLSDGEPVLNERTGEVCHTLVGEQLKFDMRDGFPAITTKKLAFKSMVGELLGILHGATSASEFRALGCPVWDINANESKAWLANPHRKGVDDLGRSYGSQWTDWSDMRIIDGLPDLDFPSVSLEERGYQVVGNPWKQGDQWKTLVRRGINQVEEALRAILTNPSDRRIIINGWRPDEHDRTALPVCHMTYTFVPNVRLRRLDLVMHQRSWDTFLAFNIPMCALFLHIMSRLSGYEPGVVTMQIANAHVYASHADAVRLMLSREHYPQPRLVIDEAVPSSIEPRRINGIFRALQPQHFRLDGYEHHPAIKVAMVA